MKHNNKMGSAQSNNPTESDSDCHINPLTQTCYTTDSKDASTCQVYSGQCYSTSAPQCSSHADCAISLLGTCENRAAGSSLYCRHTGLFGECECSRPTLTAQVWPTAVNGAPFFPEHCDPRFRAAAAGGVSLAYGGGGTRAYVALMGYLRFLNRAGLDTRAAYVSSSSGGSWFHGVYAFAQPRYSPAELLGESVQPAQASLEALDASNAHYSYMGARAADADVTAYMLQALAPGSLVSSNEAYTWALGKIFLEPYDLNVNAPVAATPAHAAQIEQRNNQLSPALTPVENSPFWLCNATLLTIPNPTVYPMLTFTPLYTGSVTSSLWLETVAFGAEAPDAVPVISDPCTGAIVSVSSTRQRPPTLRTFIGVSSGAIAVKVFQPDPPIIFSLNSFIDDVRIWSSSALPPITTSSAYMSDGGFIDNTGIVALLARGQTKIVSFINTSHLLEEPDLCMEQVQALFARSNKCDSDVIAHDDAQVFESAEYDRLFGLLQTERLKGLRDPSLWGPTYARMTLRVRPNPIYGVVGNYDVDILFILLQPAPQFNAQLPADTRAEIAEGKSLANFPFFKTLFQNLGIMEYTKRQVNLLAAFTDWCVSHPSIQAHIADMFAAQMRFECSANFTCQKSLLGEYAESAACVDSCRPAFVCVNGNCSAVRGNPQGAYASMQECTQGCTAAAPRPRTLRLHYR